MNVLGVSEMSSCSSECDCYLCQYGMGCQNIQPGPFYATMGQPLVYFADVPPVPKKEPKRPNCFIRAFRWYTEERRAPLCVMRQERCSKMSDAPAQADPDPKVPEFAAWLDSKYEEYLQENVDPNACCVKRTEMSVIETCTPVPQSAQETNSTPDPCCTKKKFGKIKSPWAKKRGRHERSKSKDKSSGDEKTPQSMEYIMHPKELSRAASECCHATPTSCGSVMIKSQSLTSVAKACSQEGEKSVKLDQPPVEKRSLCKSATREILPKCSNEQELKTCSQKCEQNNVSCQCFVCVDRSDVQTQYYTSEFESSCCRSGPPSTAVSSVSTPQEKEKETGKHEKKADKHSPKHPKKSSVSVRQSDASCQCQCPVNVKVDAVVQYEEPKTSPCAYPAPRETCLDCPCVTCHEILYTTRLYPRPPDGTLQSVIISTAPSTTGKCSINCPFYATKSVTAVPTPAEVKSEATGTTPCQCRNQTEDAAQTSDHSITLDATTVHDSFFLKIVCTNEIGCMKNKSSVQR